MGVGDCDHHANDGSDSTVLCFYLVVCLPLGKQQIGKQTFVTVNFNKLYQKLHLALSFSMIDFCLPGLF